MAPAARDNPNYGKGRHRIQLSEEEGLLVHPVRAIAKLRSVLRAPGYQPPMLPAVALELVQLTQNPEVPFSKVKGLIQSEPLVAARVLKLAQSAHYSRGAQITSLEDAMSRLGLGTLTDLFLQESMTAKVFKSQSYQVPMEALRKHAVVTANVSRLVCRRTGFPDEYAFMCGLLHDVGLAAGILIMAELAGSSPPNYELVEKAIEAVHEEASMLLARSWELPADIQLVLGHHHRIQVEGQVHPLAAAICFADWVAAKVGVPAGTEVNEAWVKKAVEALGFRDKDVEALCLAAENFVAVA